MSGVFETSGLNDQHPTTYLKLENFHEIGAFKIRGAANKLLSLAQEAFTNGINTVAAVSAVLVILLAIFTVITLRNVRPSGEE